MPLETILLIVALILSAVAAAFSAACFMKNKNEAITEKQLDKMLDERNEQMEDSLRELRTELAQSIAQTLKMSSDLQSNAQRQMSDMQNERLRELTNLLAQRQTTLQNTVSTQLAANEQRLESIRKTMETSIANLQMENSKKLDEMRNTVDEKLQKTLDQKLAQSFARVTDQLEKVYKGLGEMQTLATGVGDLKKVLSNVKTRGILGEIQLGAILEQILSKEQYLENVATVTGSTERVEFAVKLPGDGETPVLLPIDAKFPVDAYSALLEAYETANAQNVEAASKALEQRIRGFAKDIHTKYINVPETTDFGIMFVPVEGLYSELVRRGMIEKLQAEYKVVITGPTTMAALLNSLQMGFKTLAIQKRSSEVWKVLGSVKSEFDNFGKALEQTQMRMEQASSELEKLVGVRTRQMIRKLSAVSGTAEIEEE